MSMRGGFGIYKKKIVKMEENVSIEPGREVIVWDLEDYIASKILFDEIGKEEKDKRIKKVWNYFKTQTESEPLAEVFEKLGLKPYIEKRKVEFYKEHA